MCAALHDMEELSQPITDVETDGKGLPILLRQYAKIGGRLFGFNVDRKFSNVLDGLGRSGSSENRTVSAGTVYGTGRRCDDVQAAPWPVQLVTKCVDYLSPSAW